MTTDATVAEPTHHIVLDDGSSYRGLVLCDSKGLADHRQITKVPNKRLPLKLQQGGSEYSDFMEPYVHAIQKDFSGGTGQEDERDSTRYWFGRHINSMHTEKVMLGPRANYIEAVRLHIDNQYQGDKFIARALFSNTIYRAATFTPSANITVQHVDFFARYLGTPGTLTVEIWTDSGGDPDAVIAGATGSIATSDAISEVLDNLQTVEFGTPPALTASTVYWVVFIGEGGVAAIDNYWSVWDSNPSAGVGRNSANGSLWGASNASPSYRLVASDDEFKGFFFDYKSAKYLLTSPDDVSAPQLFISGDRGESIGASTLTTLEHTGKGWTTDEWKGATVRIIAGAGVGDWREITGNDADTLTVSPAWGVTPSTTTEYVIIGSDIWTEILGHGLTVQITDVEVVEDIVYFCQGEGTYIRRFNYDANTNSFAADGTNVCNFLKLVHDSGGAQVHRGNIGATATVGRADPVSWGGGTTNLSFGNQQEVGHSTAWITGLDRYFDPEYLIIFTERGVFRRVGDEIQQMPIREMEHVMSEFNGAASTVGGVYLYFSLLHGFQRYYNNRLDDYGPNRDDGIPVEHQGVVTGASSYPGRIYISTAPANLDSTNRSVIYTNNGLGWHPIYESLPGRRITDISFQPVPGSTLDRLWVCEGSDVFWLPMPSFTFDPSKDDDYVFYPFGYLETSWIYVRLRDLQKTFTEITYWTENYDGGNTYLVPHYKIDEGSWQYLDTDYAQVPSGVSEITTSASQQQGTRIKFMIAFLSLYSDKTPVLKALDLSTVIHLPTKFRYSAQFRVGDENIDLRGDEESYAVGTFMAALETWANDGTMLTMRHHNEDGPLDNKSVFISAPTLRPISNIDDENLASYLGTMEIFEA